MIAVLIILALVCAVLALRVYSLEKNLRQGAMQLKERREDHTASPLRFAAPNAAAEALLSEMNGLLRDMEEERHTFRTRELALREQIANVSHDLRTPLTSIVGYLQLLEDEGLPEERRREYLEIIEHRAEVLQGLISSFYDLSRLEAGAYPIAREKVNLREVLGDLLAAFYDELESRFQVTVDLPDDLPPVWGDRSALTRVYANLLRNALEHGGERLSISAAVTEGSVKTVLMNGEADLRPEDLERVFDRFFTSDRTRSGKNAGLGLAIVKALCVQMGGTCRAELNGNDFSMTLSWKT